MVTGLCSCMNTLDHVAEWQHLYVNGLAHTCSTTLLAFLKNENKTPVFKDSKFLLKVKINNWEEDGHISHIAWKQTIQYPWQTVTCR